MDLYEIWELREKVGDFKFKEEDDKMNLLVKERVFNTNIKTGSVIRVGCTNMERDYLTYYGIVRNVTKLELDYVRVGSNGYIVDRTITLEDIIKGIIDIELILYPPENKKDSITEL